MHPRLLALLVAAAAIAACTPGTITDTPSGGTPSDTSTNHDTTVVQRGTLNVHVAIDDSSDAAIAATAGVSVVGLTVHLSRDAPSEAPQTAITDAAGNVQFTHLVPASYQVGIDRPLTPAESARLAPADREASLFAAGKSVYVAPPTTASYVTLVAARRGSLVVSELYYFVGLINGCSGCGSFSQYIEFYNNGDTTVYMDGMLKFSTNGATHSFRPNTPCSLAEAQRLDDTGLWVSNIERFPGTGREYPVLPGAARVWAIDAVDNSSLGGGMQDLRRADFESIGSSADPDNPGAANMIRMTSYSTGPHGPIVSPGQVYGVALPVARDTSELARVVLTFNGLNYPVFKIPRAAILDVATARPTPEYDLAFGSSFCEPFTSPVFDQAPARIVVLPVAMAMSRRSLGFTPGGAEILQRTRNSTRDFVLANTLLRSLRR